MGMMVTNAKTAQSTLVHWTSFRPRHKSEATMINTPPAAHGGMEAMMGAKKTEMQMNTAVSPVLPPGSTPAADSV